MKKALNIFLDSVSGEGQILASKRPDILFSALHGALGKLLFSYGPVSFSLKWG